MLYAKQDGSTPMPVFVLPATAEAYDAMVEQISARKTPGRYPVPIGAICARAALAALGITRPKALSPVRPTQ